LLRTKHAEIILEDLFMFCSKCGTQANDDAGFCSNCGNSMGGNSTVATTDIQQNANSEKLENLYKIARRAVTDGNPSQAVKCYEQILLEDPDNWEPNFFIAYYTARLCFTNDSPGGSCRVVGGRVSLSYEYRSGITSCINTIYNCIETVFSLIEDIEDYDEQQFAMNTVEGNVKSLAQSVNDVIDDEHARMKMEIAHYIENTNDSDSIVGKGLDKYTMGGKNDLNRDACKRNVSDIISKVESGKRRIEEVVAKRRFDAYWEEHKEERAALESEKRSLNEQIAKFREDIKVIPGYTEMNNERQELDREKDNAMSSIEKPKTGSLTFLKVIAILASIVTSIITIYWMADNGGLYDEALVFLLLTAALIATAVICSKSIAKKLKPYKMQQANVESGFENKLKLVNEKYSRVISEMEAIEKKIASHESKIDDIDHELTRPR
jgi:tetratricopeptide (TPR) repeat protein